ncbi:MAG: hypothetical protein R3345_05020, partial [Fulvivirga sp.]|nr:hypothetical protein [Fulvivirga sp.]
SGDVTAYALGGLNLATIGFDNPFGDDDSNTELGLNLGIGTNFNINSSVMPFAQLRFVIGDADQAVLSFGVKFNI